MYVGSLRHQTKIINDRINGQECPLIKAEVVKKKEDEDEKEGEGENTTRESQSYLMPVRVS